MHRYADFCASGRAATAAHSELHRLVSRSVQNLHKLLVKWPTTMVGQPTMERVKVFDFLGRRTLRSHEPSHEPQLTKLSSNQS